MFKQHYHIIFIILLILALQFQLLHPAFVECVLVVFMWQIPVRPFTKISLQSFKRASSQKDLKSSNGWFFKNSPLRIYVMGEEKSVSLDTKANNATRVQNDTILTKTWPSPERKRKAMNVWGSWLFQSRLLSISSFCPPSITDTHPNVLFSVTG